MKRFLAILCIMVFALVGCSDDSETTDAAVADAAVDVAAEAAVEAGQLEASVEASVDDLVVIDIGSSDTVTLPEAGGE